jgi:hypothetical protein
MAEIIKANVSNVREFIERRNYTDTNVVDLFSVMYILVNQKNSIEFDARDRHVQFIIDRIRKVPAGAQRVHWFDTMFRLFEKMSATSPNDPTWLLLQADLVYSTST